MEISHLIYELIFVIMSLLIGGLLKHFLKKTPIPYTVGLFLFGLIGGFLVRFNVLDNFEITKHIVTGVSNADPDLILYLFLPVLIFDAAYELDVHVFRKNLGNASLLAGPGMVIAMFLTGALMIFLHSHFGEYSGWTWDYALMFGALISATDPVAVVALLKELKINKRFTTLVDAESMLNDGTGIVLFMIFFGVYTSAGEVTSPVADFFFVVFGGVSLGLLVAYLCLKFISKVHSDSMIQNSIIIVSAYLVFLLAQSLLNVSGVIALVCFGLFVSYYGRLKIRPRVIAFMDDFWALAAHLGNTLIFIIVGIIIALKTDFTLSNFIVLGCLYIGLNVIRWLMIMMLYPMLKRCGYGLTMKETVVLSWGGLRGALGLTLGLMVSYATAIPEEVRHQVLFLTGGIVTLTLLVNATTIRWILRVLGFNEESKVRKLFEFSVQQQLNNEMKEYYKTLQTNEGLKQADWNEVENYLVDPVKTFDSSSIKPNDFISDIRLSCVRREKRKAWELYEEAIINQTTLKKILLLADDMHDVNGHLPLTQQAKIFEQMRKPTTLLGFPAPQWYRKFLDHYFPGKTVKRYDLTRGFLLQHRSAIKLLEDYEQQNTFSEQEKDSINIVRQEILSNIDEAKRFMERLERRHPENYKKAITIKTVRMLLNKKKEVISQYAHDGLMSADDAESMIDDLNDKLTK